MALPGLAGAALVALTIAWDYGGVPEGMKLYDLRPGVWKTWLTGVAPNAEETPAAREIPDATVRLRRGETRQVVLFYRNATKSPVRFFAAPHSVTPARAALGFKFLCLCTSRVYTVPPGGVWYRVVELRVARDFAGDRLTVVHQLLSADEKSAADFRDGMSRKEAL
jgi:hypothetical protein